MRARNVIGNDKKSKQQDEQITRIANTRRETTG